MATKVKTLKEGNFDVEGKANKITNIKLQLKKSDDIITCFVIGISDSNGKYIDGIHITLNKDGSLWNTSIYDHSTKGKSTIRFNVENENGTIVEVFKRDDN